jgi:hypothetical protein
MAITKKNGSKDGEYFSCHAQNYSPLAEVMSGMSVIIFLKRITSNG